MIQNLFNLVSFFDDVRGLNVNRHKSELIGINFDELWLVYLGGKHGCNIGDWNLPISVSLYGKPSSSTFWQPIIDKIEKRLQSWKHNRLSKGARLTLISATLTNLPTYYLSLFHIPSKVVGLIESLYKQILWSCQQGKNLSHLLNWERVKHPMEEGGLRTFDIKHRNHSLLAKWSWRFQKEKNIVWRKIILMKHGSNH